MSKMKAPSEVAIIDDLTGLVIIPARDNNLTDFSRKLLADFYLKPGETPQKGFARASFAWSKGDRALAQRLYEGASRGWFMFASPVLSNAPEVATLNPLTFKKIKGLPISCFTGETQVFTDKGFKNIEDIKVGDYVLSDDGSYNEVEAFREQESDDLYEITIDGETITTTGNHLFMTKEHGWVRVDELDPSIHELVSRD